MDKELLVRIYNTMLLIETKGQSTLYMADCIRGIQDVINAPQPQQGETNEIPNTES